MPGLIVECFSPLCTNYQLLCGWFCQSVHVFPKCAFIVPFKTKLTTTFHHCHTSKTKKFQLHLNVLVNWVLQLWCNAPNCLFGNGMEKWLSISADGFCHAICLDSVHMSHVICMHMIKHCWHEPSLPLSACALHVFHVEVRVWDLCIEAWMCTHHCHSSFQERRAKHRRVRKQRWRGEQKMCAKKSRNRRVTRRMFRFPFHHPHFVDTYTVFHSLSFFRWWFHSLFILLRCSSGVACDSLPTTKITHISCSI